MNNKELALQRLRVVQEEPPKPVEVIRSHHFTVDDNADGSCEILYDGKVFNEFETNRIEIQVTELCALLNAVHDRGFELCKRINGIVQLQQTSAAAEHVGKAYVDNAISRDDDPMPVQRGGVEVTIDGEVFDSTSMIQRTSEPMNLRGQRRYSFNLELNNTDPTTLVRIANLQNATCVVEQDGRRVRYDGVNMVNSSHRMENGQSTMSVEFIAGEMSIEPDISYTNGQRDASQLLNRTGRLRSTNHHVDAIRYASEMLGDRPIT